MNSSCPPEKFGEYKRRIEEATDNYYIFINRFISNLERVKEIAWDRYIQEIVEADKILEEVL